MNILDAHVHLWDTEAFALSWLGPELNLRSQYLPTDFEQTAGPGSGAVCVQGGESLAEARWLLEAARTSAPICALVLQYTPAAAGWGGVVHEALQEDTQKVIAGLRLPARRASSTLEDVPQLRELCEGLIESGGLLELLTRGDQLEAVAQLASDFQDLTIVIDHAGLGADEPDELWKRGIGRLAAVPSVAVKISGLFAGPWATAVVSHLLDEVPVDRLMVGSDWPMSTRVASYADIVERTQSVLEELSDDDAAQVWAGTAERVYIHR